MSLSPSGHRPRVASIITPDTSQIASVKMSTPDSIGSCSSHENTDSLPGTPKQRVDSCKVIGDNRLCSHQNELSSPSTLFSISGNHIQAPISPTINTTSDSVEYVRRAVILFEDKIQELPDTEFSSLPVVKKPSYLGISCSLSGYSSLTSYDSKIREGFRTRDRSPAPPHQKLVYNMPNTDDHNGIESTFQVNCKTPPLERQKDSPPAERGISSKKQKFLALGCKNLSLSSLPGSCGANCRENTVCYSLKSAAQQKNETDICTMSRRCYVSSSTSSKQTNLAIMPPLSALSTSTSLSPTPGAVRVTKLLCSTKSFVHTQVPSHEKTGSIEDHGVVGTSGVHNTRNSEDSTCTIEECKTPKSFVQQRIERLYGPGALAQSFISRVRKISSSFDESPKQVCANPGIALSNPHLPVLRHLRPEFRAQLPLTCNPSSKLQRQLHMTGQLVPNTSSPGPESSITSLADSQPAAPDVPVIKAETPLILSERSSVDSQLVPMKSRTVADTPNTCSSLSANCAVESRRTLSQSLIEDSCVNEQEMNGHHFLKVLHKEIERLSGLADQAEHELYHIQCLSEDAQGKLRAASGQARLLVKQKLQQFEGLCNKNISQCPEDPFPTTAQDLEGFWDMVKLQIDHVDLLFSEIDVLRKHNWEDNTEHETNSGVINGSRRRRSMHHCTQKPASVPLAMAGTKVKGVTPTGCDKKKNDSTRRSREEQSLARKKLMEERRQALKAQQAKSEQHIEIYVASRSGK